jgi:hypothetical protein
MSTVTVFENDVQMIVVYDGPRGLKGVDGDPGPKGPKGTSIRPLGAWQNNVQYVTADAVTWRSSVNPNVDALYIAREGATPSVGLQPHLDPASWMETYAPNTTDHLGPVWQVTQLGHPFTMIGQPACFNPDTGFYQLADARYETRLMIGIVIDIPDGDHVTFQAAGELPYLDPHLIFDPVAGDGSGRDDSDWIPGKLYYLSSVPGLVQEEPPSRDGWIDQFVLVPTENNGDGSMRGVIVTWGPGGDGASIVWGGAAADIDPPPNPKPGQLWYRQDDFPGLYVWLEGPLSANWVQANG